MSPEQARGEGWMRAAICSRFGAVLYRDGYRPTALPGENRSRYFQCNSEQYANSPKRLNPDCPGDLEKIIQKASGKGLFSSLPDCQEVMADLQGLRHDLISGKQAKKDPPPDAPQSLYCPSPT